MKLPASFRQILSTSSNSNEIEFIKVNCKVKTKSIRKFKKWNIFNVMKKTKYNLERINIVLVDIDDNFISANEIGLDFI